MKKFRLFVFALFVLAIFMQTNSFGQTLFYDGFTGTGNIGGNCTTVGATPDCFNNGWYTHSGPVGTINIIPGSLSYTGLPAPTGNKIIITGAASLQRDVNAPITVNGDVAYYSALINVHDTVQTTSFAYFMHFAVQSGNTGVTYLFARLGFINAGSKFRLGICNNSGGSPTYTEFPTDLDYATTHLVVVKFDKLLNTASLWVDPTSLGGAEPTGQVTNNTGTNTSSAFGSICIRNALGTPQAEIDEIRVSTTWAGATSTGINEISDISKFQVLPNPSNGKFIIEYAPKTTYNVKIINAIGSVVYSQANINSSLTLDLSGFNKGIYFVQLNDNNSKAFASRKIVVE